MKPTAPAFIVVAGQQLWLARGFIASRDGKRPRTRETLPNVTGDLAAAGHDAVAQGGKAVVGIVQG